MSPSRKRWVVGASLAAFLLFGSGVYHWLALSLAQRRLDRRLATLKAERERLTEEQQRLQTDPTYVEGLIRTTFKVTKPGEYAVPLDPTGSTSNRHR